MKGVGLMTLVQNKPGLLLRLAMLPVIWGLVLTGWFSLTQALLEHEMPGLQASMQQDAAHYAARLARLQQPLTVLANDTRLSDGRDEGSRVLRQRVLYEFQYLYNQPEVHVMTTRDGQSWQPAGATPLALPVAMALAALDQGEQGALMVGTVESSAARLVLLRRHASRPLLVALSLPWKALDAPVPGDMSGRQPQSADEIRLLTRQNGQWRNIHPQSGRIQVAEAPDTSGLMPAGPVLASLQVVQPLPGWPGWWLTRQVNVAGLNQNILWMQMGLVGTGGVLTLLLLWPRVGLGLRRRPARTMPVPLTRLSGDSGRAGYGAGTPYTPGKIVANESSALRPRNGAQRAVEEAEKQKVMESIRQKHMLQKIQHALAHDGVHGAYQPIFRASDGVPVMHEVLLRLEDPSGEDIAASDFIKLAQQNDMMPQLDAALLKHIIREHFAGGQQPATRLALNLSSRTFDRMTYMQDLMSSAHNGILAQLVFEVRSRELLSDPSAIRFLHELKSMGAQLSVDYFGGGRGMLEVSKKLGFDYVKVDADSMWSDLNKRRELIGLAKIASSLKLSMVLEKVEALPIEVFARRIGVPFLQGYHFARPSGALVTDIMPSWRELAQQPVRPAKQDGAEVSAEPMGARLSDAPAG